MLRYLRTLICSGNQHRPKLEEPTAKNGHSKDLGNNASNTGFAGAIGDLVDSDDMGLNRVVDPLAYAEAHSPTGHQEDAEVRDLQRRGERQDQASASKPDDDLVPAVKGQVLHSIGHSTPLLITDIHDPALPLAIEAGRPVLLVGMEVEYVDSRQGGK